MFSLHFNKDTRAWWENFLKRNGRAGKVNPKWILPILKKQTETLNRPLQVSGTADELFELIEREERDAEVNFFSLGHEVCLLILINPTQHNDRHRDYFQYDHVYN